MVEPIASHHLKVVCDDDEGGKFIPGNNRE